MPNRFTETVYIVFDSHPMGPSLDIEYEPGRGVDCIDLEQFARLVACEVKCYFPTSLISLECALAGPQCALVQAIADGLAWQRDKLLLRALMRD